ncbi:MAG: N-acetylmuramoyl-L-alanine amidase [Candidatus Omnitrophica bacterium]|nr:MAG: N-acetylmuramoyl-L-alanine amidase [Candidatus Hinthialibacteria bacterium OLB16]MBE7488097.1 N-acetylmuramoyl-L-alanine amidase [bacterium]MBK7496442.1 N-acetylmuramoyl-L-alanine amidase [Candidatus Omnitrophota bacterium]MCE7908688.1 hypothetical protein [Candidatus Omnitrophica bacterium COP1]MBV6482685.1 hypothetical protein [bacterium]
MKVLCRTSIFILRGMLLTLVVAGSLMGCSSWWKGEEEGEFSYKEPEPPPLVEPETIRTHEFLRESPSGRLYSLNPQSIAIVAQPDFIAGSDPRSYLRSEVTRAKKAGASFLPLHYYVAPDGLVYEGQSTEYAGELAHKRIQDSLLVGILGDFSQPTNFLPPPQEKTMIQLCAWLCAQHSINPGKIIPANQVNPDAEPLGVNLKNWFGPTDLLRKRVQQTLDKASAEAAKQKEGGFFFSGSSKEKRRPPDINEDF